MPQPSTWGPTWGVGGGAPGGMALPMPPDLAGNVQQVERSLSLPLPAVFPLPDAQVFNSACQQASVIIQTFTLAFTPAVNILAGYFAVVNSFTIYVQNMLATTNVVYALLANGSPVQGYTGLTIFPGASPRISNTFDAPIYFTGAQTLTVQITNGDGGTYLLGASISGWQWPISSDRRWKSSGPADAG
jgi:hypothetical protein